jgi:hypothetical protein
MKHQVKHFYLYSVGQMEPSFEEHLIDSGGVVEKVSQCVHFVGCTTTFDHNADGVGIPLG